MLIDARRRRELRDFLRARREALSPQALGLSTRGRRRTPGLRREEVARIAELGVTWYTWLEQGREISVSVAALKRIAQALRLSPTDETYLLSLVGVGVHHHSPYVVESAELSVLAALTATPALILGPSLERLAANWLAEELFTVPVEPSPFSRNHAWLLFMADEWRELYSNDWSEVARRTVGVLRARHATRVGDPQFEALLQALRTRSPDFARLWRNGGTAPLDAIEVRMKHPRFGPLSVRAARFTVPAAPDCFLSALVAADAATTAAFNRATSERATADTLRGSELPSPWCEQSAPSQSE